MRHLILLLVLLSSSLAYSQWTNLPGPYGGGVQNIIHDGHRLYLGTNRGLFFSEDDGVRWTCISDNENGTFWFTPIFAKNETIFVNIKTFKNGNAGTLTRSTDNGKTYQVLFDSCFDYTIANIDDTLFLCRRSPYRESEQTQFLYRSNDLGINWTDITPTGYAFDRILSDGRNLYATRSTLPNSIPLSIVYSRDGGRNWTEVSEDSSTKTFEYVNLLCTATYSSDTVLYVSFRYSANDYSTPTFYEFNINRGVFKPVDFPHHQNPYKTISLIRGAAFNGKSLVAGGYDGLFYLNSYTGTWKNISYNLRKYNMSYEAYLDKVYSTLDKNGNELILLTPASNGGLCRLVLPDTVYMPSDTGVNSIISTVITSHNGSIYTAASSKQFGLYKSDDSGMSWVGCSTNIDSTNSDIRCLFSTPKGLLIGNKTTILLYSDDTVHLKYKGKQVLQFASRDNLLFARASGSILVSRDGGESWNELTSQKANRDIVTNSKYLFVNSDTIFRSSDDGETWERISDIPEFSNRRLSSLTSSDNHLFVSSHYYNGKMYVVVLYHSSDEGLSWQPITPEFDADLFSAYSLQVLEDKLLVLTTTGLFRCNFDGSNWTKFDSLIGRSSVLCAYNDTTNRTIYLGTNSRGIWRAPHSYVLSYTNGIPVKNKPSSSSASSYPNPCNDDITLKCTNEVRSISLFDMRGVEIKLDKTNISVRGDQVTLNTSELTPGLYVCWLYTSDDVIPVKFIRE
jgi:photosystem II stability/assembly factor-like uncharacterized protein